MHASVRQKNKIASYKYGKISESLVVFYLILKGYRIVARNFRTHLGEIDIIAARRKSLAIIEVKARKSKSMEILTAKQQKRIINAASIFIAKRHEFEHSEIRFDLIIFKPFSIKHVKDCWRP